MTTAGKWIVGLLVAGAAGGGAWWWARRRGALEDTSAGDGGGGDMGKLDKPTSRSLEDLVPDVRAKVEAVIADLKAQGYEPYVYETKRSEERAAHLKTKGVSKLGSKSKHVPGRAADIVDGRKTSAGQRVWWGAGSDEADTMAKDFFAALGGAAKRAGLTWGGDWTGFYDPAHVEG